MTIQFYRWDRENDLDASVEQSDHRFFEHHYGDQIDRLLDELVGDEFDRYAEWPTANVPETGVTVTLHEDGPTFVFLVEQLPAFLSATTAVFTAWMTWRSRRDSRRSRSARIEVGGHTYDGPARTPEELAAIARTLAALTPEESPPS